MRRYSRVDDDEEYWYCPDKPADAAVCPECWGEKTVLAGRRGSPETGAIACPTCDGKGWVMPADEAVN